MNQYLLTPQERVQLRAGLDALNNVLKRTIPSSDLTLLSIKDARDSIGGFLELVKPENSWLSGDVDLYREHDVSQLTVDELQAIKEAWTKAGDDIISACFDIVKVLGEYESKKHGAYYRWESDGLKIVYDSWNGYMTAMYDGKPTCHSRGRNNGFVPGKWVSIVDSYHAVALEKKHQEQVQETEQLRLNLVKQLTSAK